MASIYGYCRVSTTTQKIERQRENILAYCSNITRFFEESYTGTTTDRPQFNKLLKIVESGDTIIFDCVSRMARNSEEGTRLYFELFDRGVDLVFLKQPHINTTVYREALNNKVELTDTDIDDILIGVNMFLKRLASKQIEQAFESAQTEVDLLRERTREGLKVAKANGKQVGNVKGCKLTTKKSITTKERMLKVCSVFGGYCSIDEDCIKILGVSRNTYYKYKKELKEELGIQ